MSSTIAVDFGFPYPVYPEGAEAGHMVYTWVCASPSCSTKMLHLECVPAVGLPGGKHKVDRARTVELVWDAEKRALSSQPDAIEEIATTAGGNRLLEWIAEQSESLHGRFARHRAHVEHRIGVGSAPEWRPGERLFHADVRPGAFTPYVAHEGVAWAIFDAHCPEPTCSCEDVTLQLAGPDGASEEASGTLGKLKPSDASSRRAKTLWRAAMRDPRLRAHLEARHRDVREAGPWVAGCAYERARRARVAEADALRKPALDGYLLGGKVDPAVIERMFETWTALYEAEAWHLLPHDVRVRVDVDGDVSATAWLATDAVRQEVLLFRAAFDEEPWLIMAWDDRIGAPRTLLRERCAYGWPLIAGTRIARLAAVDADGIVPRPPTPQELSIALSVLSALKEHRVALTALTDDWWEGRAVGPVCFESTLERDGKTLRVRLGVADPEAPWEQPADEDAEAESAAEPEYHEPLGDDPDDAWHDEEPDELEPEARISVAAAAFTDSALSRGLPDDVVTAGRHFMHHLARHAWDTSRNAPWHAPEIVEDFLARHAPRAVLMNDVDQENAGPALHAVVAWLLEVGYVDDDGARARDAMLERALPIFERRMNEPGRFGPAKSTYAEMIAAGVDIHDQAAVDRYLGAKNRASAAAAAARDGETRAVAPRARHRWRPADGQAMPAPQSPCPCGSGRRYKKCCKLR